MASMTLSEIEALAIEALSEAGADSANAGAVARTITRAERDGSASHGLFRLAGYIGALKSGQVNGAAAPEVSRVAPGVVRVDAKMGFAPLAQEMACKPLVERAREQGIAMAALNNIHHFAALWPEVEMLAEEGLMGFAVTAALPYVAPAGGKEAIFGTNPMAFAWPRGGSKPPFAFDQAASTLARGEVMIAARDGHDVPDGVGLDGSGAMTNDPKAILEGGVQLAFGGYKGSAIALMVELMAGALIGDKFSFEAKEALGGKPGLPVGGEFILAIDPEITAGGDWREHGEAILSRIEGMDGARLAGARRHANRLDEGAREVPDAVLEGIAKARE